VQLVDDLGPRMPRMARVHVTGDATAEEMVQEAWIAAIRGIDRLEGRSAVSTWVLASH
jgi:RNA polymerase sigma-70 factor (ECF subfamily)